jgi:hypothetical protein
MPLTRLVNGATVEVSLEEEAEILAEWQRSEDRRAEQKWAAIRAERNRRLAACDWTQVDDAPLSNVQKAAWASYRQQLRELPQAQGDPFNIVWPVEP